VRHTSTRRHRPRIVATTAVTATIALTAGGLSSAAAVDRGREGGAHGQARNIILFIGDGMGAAQRNAGALAGAGLDGELVMDGLPYAGLLRTDSADPETFVTDSAAAATSLASGIKTYNGAIGVDADDRPVQTLVEAAEAAGRVTGLVTTGQVTDASTAAFGAHVADRKQQTEIARQYIEETGVDVLLGGGEDYWYPVADPGAFPDTPAEDREEGSRSDQGDLVDRATGEFGYEYVTGPDELATAENDKLLGLFANQEMFQQNPEGEGDIYDPVVSLEAMTRKAVDTLSRSDEGFVLVVEEEAVDEMAHNNNAERTIDAVLELDKAVAVGKEFAEKDGETLLIVTADHETGGMAIEGPDSPDHPDESGTLEADGISAEDGPFTVAGTGYRYFVDWTTTGHTNVEVPLTAMGPGAERFTGYHENTHVHDAMLELLSGA
jgi:alkaline phosphatase